MIVIYLLVNAIPEYLSTFIAKSHPRNSGYSRIDKKSTILKLSQGYADKQFSMNSVNQLSPDIMNLIYELSPRLIVKSLYSYIVTIYSNG